MAERHHHGSDLRAWRFPLFFLLIVLCFAGGGASRNDVLSLLYVQPAAVLLTAAMLMLPGPFDFSVIKAPLILLGALALLMVLQLVPLPSSVWTSLPGRSLFADAAVIAEIAQPARPVSLTPDRTISSLVGLVVPIAALVGYAALAPEHRSRLPLVLLGGLMVSAVLAIAQLGAGSNSALYLYDITNSNAGVGLLANRNHQAALLALGFPLLAWWALREQHGRARPELRLWLSAALVLFLLPMILVTGSRVGLVVGAVSIVATAFAFRTELKALTGKSRKGQGTLVLLALAAVLIVGGAIALSRAEAFDRLIFAQVDEDLRARNLPVFLGLVAKHFPVGTGFGSFEAIYKVYEPHQMLAFAYLNHAHNDMLEFLIDGGLGAALLLCAFLTWFVLNGLRALRKKRAAERGARLAIVGATMIFILLLVSVFDYPLRTPLLGFIFALAAAWLADGAKQRTRRAPVPVSDPD